MLERIPVIPARVKIFPPPLDFVFHSFQCADDPQRCQVFPEALVGELKSGITSRSSAKLAEIESSEHPSYTGLGSFCEPLEQGGEPRSLTVSLDFVDACGPAVPMPSGQSDLLKDSAELLKAEVLNSSVWTLALVSTLVNGFQKIFIDVVQVKIVGEAQSSAAMTKGYKIVEERLSRDFVQIFAAELLRQSCIASPRGFAVETPPNLAGILSEEFATFVPPRVLGNEVRQDM